MSVVSLDWPLWCAVCGLQRNVEAFVFLLGGPSMAYMGYGLACWAWKRLSEVRDAILVDPFQVRTERYAMILFNQHALIVCSQFGRLSFVFDIG